MIRWAPRLLAVLDDSRYAFRLIRRAPGVAALAIISVAVGTGVTIAIFQLVNALQLRPLPVTKPQELVEIRFPHPGWYPGNFDGRYTEFSYPLYEAIRARQQTFTDTFAWSPDQLTLSANENGRVVDTLWVTGTFFDVLGVKPSRGRVIGAGDDVAGCPATAVLSYDFWKREFGEQGTLPAAISVEGRSVAVLGVSASDFYGAEAGRRFDLALPTCARSEVRGDSAVTNAGYYWLAAGARLKPGMTFSAASDQLAAIAPSVFAATAPTRLPAELAKRYRSSTLTLSSIPSGFSTLREEYSRSLWVMLLTACMVLLIGCINVGSLVLARTTARAREIASRLALGASRGRLIAQLTTENFVLALLGTGAGILLAETISELVVAMLSSHGNPIFLETGVDWRTALFATILAFSTCAFFGVFPAIRITRLPASSVLSGAARTMSMSRDRRILQRGFGVAQVALSLVLAFAAILLATSLQKLATLDAGFRPEPVVVANVDLRRIPGTDETRAVIKQDILRHVAELPGVEKVADARQITWGDFYFTQVMDDRDPSKAIGEASQTFVGPGYFDALAVPVISGRDFDERDNPASPKVTIVNAEFVRRYLPHQNPIGAVVMLGRNRPFTIVGVAGNTKYKSLRETFGPVVYMAAHQNERPYLSFTIYARAQRPAEAVPVMQRTIAAAASNIRVDTQAFSEQLRDSLLRERLVSMLSAVFAMTGLVLLFVGIYGSTAVMVNGRRREFGIKNALGARRGAILWPLVRETIAVTVAGCVLGLPLSMLTARTLGDLLFEISPYSRLIAALSLIAMVLISLAAAVRPALAACKVDPLETMRAE